MLAERHPRGIPGMLSGPRSRGFSLVELMVGLTAGLFVLLVLTTFFVSQVSGNTGMLNTTRLNQELRAVMDLTVRDIRRGGYWGNAISGVWYEGSPGVTTNPLQSITVGTTVNPTTTTTGNVLQYAYDLNGNGAIDDQENYAIQLNTATTVVELVQGISTPTTTQLSDPGTTTITDLTFSLAPANASAITCIAGGTPPTLTVRELTISLTGRLTSDTSVTRTLQETVRIRTDYVTGACPPVIS
jgi:Tfp pilus assembly protein PilW